MHDGAAIMSEARDNNCHQGGGVKQRRNKRVKMRFPVRVEFPLGNGRTRVLHTHTVVVSHAGATLDVDEPVPVGMGVEVSPPFGGTLLAEVTSAWVEEESGRQRHRVSIRLLDPASWTSPERFVAPSVPDPESVTVGIHPWVWQMLLEYTAFLNTHAPGSASPGRAAESIIERALLADQEFQTWFTAKITEDIEAWEEQYVRQA